MADHELRELVVELLRKKVAGDDVEDVTVRGVALELIDLVRAHPRTADRG